MNKKLVILDVACSIMQVIGLFAIIAQKAGNYMWVIAAIGGFAAVVKWYTKRPGTPDAMLRSVAAVCGIIIIFVALGKL